MSSIIKKIAWVTLFSIAMGYLETAVVVYLRIIYYPQGFRFPLHTIGHHEIITEVFREAATIVMLISMGVLVGKNGLQRFAWFMYCFGIWDIFYYVFLKVLLNWPASILSADILFLIPVPWVGPVLAPCIVSLTMIVFALIVVILQTRGYHIKVNLKEKLCYITGCLLVLLSFLWDYFKYTFIDAPKILPPHPGIKAEMFSELTNYIPMGFNWGLFIAGEAIVLFGFALLLKKNITTNKTDATN